MNKKGVSQLISIILIILLVLASIIIVWQLIERVVKGGSTTIEEKTKCLEINLELSNVVCDADGNANGTVSRGADSAGEIAMKVIVGNNAADIANANSPDSLGTTTFTNLAGGTSGQPVVVKVAPVIGANQDIVCDPTDEITVTCA